MPNENPKSPNGGEELGFEERERLGHELAELEVDIEGIEEDKKSLNTAIQDRYTLLLDMPAFEQIKIREELNALEQSFTALTTKSLELKRRHEDILKQLGGEQDPDR